VKPEFAILNKTSIIANSKLEKAFRALRVFTENGKTRFSQKPIFQKRFGG